MKLDYQKELTPVLYGDSAVKIYKETNMPANKLCFSMHWHERMELLLIRSGSLCLHIGDKKFTAKENSIIIVPPEKSHMGISGNDGVQYSTVMFDISVFYNSTSITDKFLKPILNQSIDFIPITDNVEIIALCDSLIKEHFSEKEGSSLVVIGKIYELFGFLYRHCLCEPTLTVPNSKFKNVINYICENYCDDITSAGLSRYFGYDEAYFCRQFKSITGITPMNYVQIIRLENAKKMIKASNLKISEISTLCGFKDASYFTRCFKKRYGITPAEYIKNK